VTHDEAMGIINGSFNPPFPLSSDSPIAGSGDSLEYLFALGQLEGKSGIIIPGQEAARFLTFGELADYVAANT
jgi:acyl carrier protein